MADTDHRSVTSAGVRLRPRVHIAVCGPLDVRVGERNVSVPRGLVSRLLLLLTANHGRAVPDGCIVDSLWNEERAPRSLGPVRNAAMRLRAALGEGAWAIERIAGGYRLSADVTLDVAVIAATSSRDPGYAVQLVRGTPFADVAHEPWARRTIDVMTEQIAVVEDAYAARLEAAGEPSSLPALQELALTRPEREVRWVHLVGLLVATGRRVEALRAARLARRALAEVGLEPDSTLRRLEARALAPSTPEQPPASANRRHFQVCTRGSNKTPPGRSTFG